MRILVTGGTHGIGLAITSMFRENFDNHIITLSRSARVRNYELDHIRADLTKKKTIQNVCKEVKKLNIDILINNVGGGGRWGNEDVLSTEEDVWQEVWNKNYEAARKLTLAVLPNMIQKGFGRVITISSIYGKEAGGRPWFTVAKAAQIALMKSLSLQKDLVRHNITFNSVCPGDIYIPNTGCDLMDETTRLLFEDSLPLGRMGRTHEVAALVKFLSSKEASLINGACITADGGESFSF